MGAPASVGEAIIMSAMIDDLSKQIHSDKTKINPGTGQIDYMAMLQYPPIFNRLRYLFICNGEVLSKTPLNITTKLSYSVEDNLEIYDEIGVCIAEPAPEHNDNRYNYTTKEITLQRRYARSHRTASVQIGATAVEKIKELDNLLSKRYDIPTDNKKVVRNEAITQKAKEIMFEHATRTVNIIHTALSKPMYTAMLSVVLAVPEQLRYSIFNCSVSRSFAQSCDLFDTDLAESQVPIDGLRQIMFDKDKRRNFTCHYASTDTRNIFAMGKDPRFIHKFINEGDAVVNPIDTKGEPQAEHNITTETGAVLPVIGVLIISEKACEVLAPIIKQGQRHARIPVDLNSTEAYKCDTANGTFLLRERPYFPEMNESRFTDMDLDDDNPVWELIKNGKSRLIYNFNQTGLEMMQRPDNFVPHAGREYIHNMIGDTTDKYIDHPREAGAVVLEIVKEKMPSGYDNPHETGIGPTGVKKELVMTHVTMGDYDLGNNNITEWVARIIEKPDAPDLTQGFRCFSEPSVTAEIKNVRCGSHVFGVSELCQVMLQPHLYDSKHLLKALNTNVNVAHKLGSELASIKEVFKALETNVLYAPAHFKDMVAGKNAIDNRNNLLKIELTPFFQLSFDSLTNQYEMTHREILASLPNYIVPTCVHMRRANVLGIQVATYRKIADLLEINIQKLGDVDKTEASNTLIDKGTIKNDRALFKTSQAPYDIESPFAMLSRMLYDVLKHFFAPLSLADIFLFQDKKEFEQSILLPFITGYRITTSKKPEPDKDGKTVNKLTMILTNTRISAKEFGSNIVGTTNEMISMIALQNLLDIYNYTSGKLVQRLLAVIMAHTINAPKSISALITKKVPIGLAVDFFCIETINSNIAVYTKPDALDTIITPAPKKVISAADNNVNVEQGTIINTVTNTYGPGAYSENCIWPNPALGSNAIMANNQPKISLDSVTKAGFDTLHAAVNDNKDVLDDKDRDEIKKMLQNAERERIAVVTRPRTNVSNAYVGVIRPIRNPSCKEIPFLGFSRLEGYASSQGNFLANFYNSDIMTISPYISNPCSLYNQLFTKTLTPWTTGNTSSQTFNQVTTSVAVDKKCTHTPSGAHLYPRCCLYIIKDNINK